MKNFLNEYMYLNQNPDKKFISKITKEFEETTEKVLSVYGPKAFRRLNEEGEYETSLNRSIMDILMTSSAYFSKTELENNKDEIVECLEDLIINDSTFRNSVTISTSDTKVITYRLKRWYDEINTIVNG